MQGICAARLADNAFRSLTFSGPWGKKWQSSPKGKRVFHGEENQQEEAGFPEIQGRAHRHHEDRRRRHRQLDEEDVLLGARPGRGGRDVQPHACRPQLRHLPHHRREHERRGLHADLRRHGEAQHGGRHRGHGGLHRGHGLLRGPGLQALPGHAPRRRQRAAQALHRPDLRHLHRRAAAPALRQDRHRRSPTRCRPGPTRPASSSGRWADT